MRQAAWVATGWVLLGALSVLPARAQTTAPAPRSATNGLNAPPAPPAAPAPRNTDATLDGSPGSPGNLAGRAGANGAGRVSNVFVDTDLREVLQDIATQTGAIIIPDLSVTGIVTAELKDATLDRALEIVLAGTGFSVMKAKDYYLVYSPDPKGAAFLEVSKTRVVKLEYAEAEAAVKLLSPALQAYARADEKSHMVVVTAPQALLGRIMQDLWEIDQPPRHVLLDVRVVVLERQELLNLGVNWSFPSIRAGTFTDSTTAGNWPWGVQIGYTPAREFTASLNLTLNLLEQNTEASVVASPQVMAQDGKLAHIGVTTEEYFQIVTQGVFTQAQLQQIQSGTTLKITPRIGFHEDVTLQMEVEVSDVVARGADNLPVVTRRTATNTVRIESGGTAVVAGLMDNRLETINSKVPGAGNMPVVGGLFRNQTQRNSAKQVAVFVTATLVDDVVELPEQQARRRPKIPPVDPDAFRALLRESLRRHPR